MGDDNGKLPDLASLSRLFVDNPKAKITFSESTHTANKIFARIAANMSPELRYAALDVLAVQSREPIHPSDLTSFLEDRLTANFHDERLRMRQYSVPAMLDLIAISGGLESFVESFARDRVLGPSCLPHGSNVPLSPVELHRIRRSFWRFQLCLDICQPEGAEAGLVGVPERQQQRQNDAGSSGNPSCPRFVQHQASQPVTTTLRNWLQCRGEPYRPESLSRFLVNLSEWERTELDAVRFHLIHEVNTLQYHRHLLLRSSFSSFSSFFPSHRPSPQREEAKAGEDINDHRFDESLHNEQKQPLLLRRLLHDLDHWDPNRHPRGDHVLVASFADTPWYSGRHYFPVVWNRTRYLLGASVPNTKPRVLIQELQRQGPQWGWCLWDEERLFGRGLVDEEFEGWCEEMKERGRGRDDDGDEDDDENDEDDKDDGDDGEDEENKDEQDDEDDNNDLTAKIRERQALFQRANEESAASQYTEIDRRIMAQFDVDASIYRMS